MAQEQVRDPALTLSVFLISFPSPSDKPLVTPLTVTTSTTQSLIPAYKLWSTLPAVRDTVGGQTTEEVSHPPHFPIDRKHVLVETVLHVMEELSLRRHKSDSSKTMHPTMSSHPSGMVPTLVT